MFYFIFENISDKDVSVIFIFALNRRQFTYLCIYISKLATVVDGTSKASFSLATIQGCKGERFSFLWIAPLTLDPYLIMLSIFVEVPVV